MTNSSTVTSKKLYNPQLSLISLTMETVLLRKQSYSILWATACCSLERKIPTCIYTWVPKMCNHLYTACVKKVWWNDLKPMYTPTRTRLTMSVGLHGLQTTSYKPFSIVSRTIVISLPSIDIALRTHTAWYLHRFPAGPATVFLSSEL